MGDIIDIETDDGTGNGIFIIKFINNNKLILKNKGEDGEDENVYEIINRVINGIKSIKLLSRFKRNLKGFCQQNNLELNTRIKIIFNTPVDKPDLEIFGIIKERRNDAMGVEIKSLIEEEKDKKYTIYIDFKYHGIHETIKKIIIYETKIKKSDGEEFTSEEFTEIIEKSENYKVYTITEQLDDLYNSILSSFGENNYKVANDTNIQIQRFTHLLEEFGEEKNGLIKLNVRRKVDVPLIDEIYYLSKNGNRQYKAKLKWLIPTVTLKKIGGSKKINPSEEMYNDIITENDIDFIQSKKLQEDYFNKTNDIWYMNYNKNLYKKLNNIYKNHKKIEYEEEKINAFKLKVDIDTETIVKNDDEFFSTTMTMCEQSDSGYTRTKFSKQKIITSLPPPNLPIISPDDITSPPQKNVEEENESMFLNGFITTPYDLFKYSKIYSKNINLFEKSVLGSININNYTLNPTRENNDNSQDCDFDTKLIRRNKIKLESDESVLDLNFCYYAKEKDEKDPFEFLNKIIPNTNESIHATLKLERKKNKNDYINNVSMYRLIKNLSPFLINEHNLTPENYNMLSNILEKRVIKFNKKLEDMNNSLQKKNEIYAKNKTKFESNNLSLQLKRQTYKNTKNLKLFTNSEILQYALNCDQGDLYRIALKIEENNKLIPDVEELKRNISNYHEEIINKKKEQKNSDCNIKYILAKQYYDDDELISDNDKIIFYDKKYDDTPYYLLDDDNIKNNDDKRTILFNILKKHHDNDEKDDSEIALIAKDILVKKKIVRENDVAFIFDMNTFEKKYYMRKGNNWEFVQQNQEDFECLLKNPKTCISIKNNCESKDMNKLRIEELFLNKTREKFAIDEVYSKEDDYYNYEKINIKNYINEIIIELTENNNSRNDYESGVVYKYESSPVSPYTNILNTILSQNELDKKYKNIKIFKETYCRNSYGEEDNHFYYCEQTGKRLIPKFYYDLANAYLDNNLYETKIKEIRKIYGKNDGNYIVDKYSGYIIENIQFVKEIKFDEENRVIKTDSIIEDVEIGEKITDLKYLIQNYIINLNTALQIDEIDNELIVDLINNIFEKKYKIIYKVIFYTTVSVYFIVLQCLLNKKLCSKIKTYKGCPMNKIIVGYPINMIERPKNPEKNEFGINSICCFIREFFGKRKNLYKKDIITKQEFNNAGKGKNTVEKLKLLTATIKNNLKYYIEKVLLNDQIQQFVKENKKNIINEQLTGEYIEIKEEIWNGFLPTLKYSQSGIKGNSRKKHYQLLDKFLISKKLEKNIETNKDIDSFKNQIITIIDKKTNPLDLILIEQKYNTLKLQFILNYLINYQKNNIDLLLLHKNSFLLENSCCNSKITNMIDYIKKYNVFNNKSFKSLFNKFDNKSNFYQNLIEYYSIKNTQLVTNNNTKVKYSIVLNEHFSEKVMLEYIYENNTFPELLIIKSKNITYEKKLEQFKQYIRDALNKDVNILFKEFLYKKSNKDNEYKIREKEEIIPNKHVKLNLLSEQYSSLFKDFEHEISKVDEFNDYDNKNLIQILITILNNPTEMDIGNIDKYVGKRINKIGDILKTTCGYRNIIEKINDICNFEKLGEDLYISREVETYSYKNQFLKRCCLDIAKIYPQLVIKSDIFQEIDIENIEDYKEYKSYVEHWNLAKYHYINIETKYINPELYFLVKDSDIGVLQENKIKLESNELLKISLNVIYDIIDLMPILINNENMSLLSNIYKLIFMIIILYILNSIQKKKMV